MQVGIIQINIDIPLRRHLNRNTTLARNYITEEIIF